MPNLFAVNYSPFTHLIRAGRVNKSGTSFTSHTDVTYQAVWAVAELVEAHGEPYEIRSGGEGYRVTVERVENPGNDK